MMGLISKQDMVQRFGERELAERTDHYRAQTIDDAVLAQAIADAEAEVYSWIRAAKLKQLTRPSAALLGFACDIARYRLYDDAVTDTVQERYKQAIAWLQMAIKYPQMLDESAWDNRNNRPSSGAVVANEPIQWADWS